MKTKAKFNLQKKLSGIARDEVVFFGILFGAAMLLGVIGWDAYIFYNNVLTRRDVESPRLEFVTSLTQLSAASDQLDERQVQYEAILSE